MNLVFEPMVAWPKSTLLPREFWVAELFLNKEISDWILYLMFAFLSTHNPLIRLILYLLYPIHFHQVRNFFQWGQPKVYGLTMSKYPQDFL